jgi:hypothetical protein
VDVMKGVISHGLSGACLGISVYNEKFTGYQPCDTAGSPRIFHYTKSP